MKCLQLRLPVLLVIFAMVVSSCIYSDSLEITAYCDRAKISYVEDGSSGSDTVYVKVVSSGHIAAQQEIVTNGADGDAHTITVTYDQKYPEGTVMGVYFGSNSDPSATDDCSNAGHHLHGATWFDPGDSRLNRQAYAYAAIYCDDTNQRVGIYGIHSASTDGGEAGVGFPAIFVPYTALPPTPSPEQGNTLIQQYANVGFYRLTTGEYQVNAGPDNEGKTYVVIFDGCPNTTMHAYMMQNGVMTPSEVYPR